MGYGSGAGSDHRFDRADFRELGNLSPLESIIPVTTFSAKPVQDPIVDRYS